MTTVSPGLTTSERFSYVAVARESANRAIQLLGAGRIKGKKFKVGLPR